MLCTKVGRLLFDDAAADPDAAGFAGALRRNRRLDYSADGVRRSLTESLERLGLDRVDLALIHDPEDHLAQALGEAAPALAALKAEGVIRGWGVGTNFAATAERFVAETDLDHLMIAGRYTLLDRRADRLLTAAAERGVGVLTAGILNSNVLVDPAPGPGSTTCRPRSRCWRRVAGWPRCAAVTGCRCARPRCSSGCGIAGWPRSCSVPECPT